MAAFRFSRTDDSQMDPFNAGEPELPGGKPDSLSGGEPELRQEPKPREPQGPGPQQGSRQKREARRRPEPRQEPRPKPRYTAHGEPGGEPHKRADDYQAPVTAGHDYDAPSTDDPPREPRPRKGRARKTHPEPDGAGGQTKRGRRPLARLVVAIVLLAAFGPLLVGCTVSLVVAATEGAYGVVEDLGYLADAFFDDLEDANPDEDILVVEQDEDDLAAAAALEARLDALLAEGDGGTLHELVSSYFEDKVLSVERYAAEQLGLDTEMIARRFLEDVSAEVDYAYAFSDGTASAYATIISASGNGLFWALEDAIGSYLAERGLWGQGAASPTAADRERVAELAEEALEGYDGQVSYFVGFDLELVDGEWVMDERDLLETLEYALDLY